MEKSASPRGPYPKARPYRRRVPRECAACQAPRPPKEGPDPCLGWLPGVRYACCGHGFAGHCYLLYEDGRYVEYEIARNEQIALGGHPPEFSRPGLGKMSEQWKLVQEADA